MSSLPKEPRKDDGREIADAKRQADRFFSLIPDLAVIASTDGFFKRVNAAWEGTLGYTAEELLSTPFADLIHPDDIETTNAEVARQLAGSFTLGFVNRYRHKNGSYRRLEWRATPALDGHLLFATARDITERELTEKKLRESEERFRSLFENATVGIYVTTPDGRIEMANPTIVRLLGYESFSALAERNLERDGFEPGYSRQVFRDTLARDGIVRGLECAWTRRDGSVVFVRESARAVKDETGAVRFYQGIVEDITERKNAEKRLADSEEKFRAVFMNGPDALYMATLEEGRLIDCNEAFERLFGYTREEINGKTSIELGLYLHPADRSGMVAELKAEGRVANFETIGVSRSGRVFTASLSVVAMTLEGKPCIAGAVREITDRKLAEDALRESEEKYRSLFESSSDAVLLTAPDGRIFAANPEACRIFGRSEAEICRLGRAGLVDQDDPRLPLLLEERARTGKARGELTFIRPDGTRFPAEISTAVFTDREGALRTSMILHDITARKHTEIQLSRSQAELKAIYENAPVMMCVVDEDRRVLYVNRALAEFTNTPQEALKDGRACGIFGCINALDDPRGCGYGANCKNCALRLAMLDTLGTGAKHSEVEYRTTLARNGEGRDVVLLGSTALIHAADQTFLLLCLHDITERKRLEDELRQAQKMESVGRLAGGVAHDFNNLLNVILGYSGLARRGLKAGDPVIKHVAEVEKAAERAADLTQQLLTFSRRQVVQPRPFSFNDLARGLKGCCNGFSVRTSS